MMRLNQEIGFLLLVLFSIANCSSVNNIEENTVAKRPLNYPVVLVHGIMAHDRKSSVDYWGRIPKTLEDRGTRVFFGNTDAWGDYESNALILKNTIEKILFETKKDKVHIIAHSKGGIDARYCIWKYSFGDKVATLTTIATPHHGAEIADFLYRRKILHTKIVKNILAVFGRLYGDDNPNLYRLIYQLTTENMKDFNAKVVMDERIYYQSFYTSMRNSFDDLTFFYTYLYIKTVIGKNDGVVSEKSAQWGNNIREIKGGISHAEILDIKKKNISGVDIPSIYVSIIDELWRMGL